MCKDYFLSSFLVVKFRTWIKDFSLFPSPLQVQAGLRLPLTSLASPRLLMCSASMGAEGSVTLQLREAVQAPIVNESTATINNVTIGYPDADVLADVIGTFQASNGNDGTFDVIEDSSGRPHNFTNTLFKAANSSTLTTTINKTETGTWFVYEFQQFRIGFYLRPSSAWCCWNEPIVGGAMMTTTTTFDGVGLADMANFIKVWDEKIKYQKEWEWELGTWARLAMNWCWGDGRETWEKPNEVLRRDEITFKNVHYGV